MAVMSLRFSGELLAAWGSPAFSEQFKAAVEALPHSSLPLQQGLARTSYVSNEPFRVMVKSSSATEQEIAVHVSIFYSGIIAGCSCADDPTPIEPQTEYCVVRFVIDRDSGEAEVDLQGDD